MPEDEIDWVPYTIAKIKDPKDLVAMNLDMELAIEYFYHPPADPSYGANHYMKYDLWQTHMCLPEVVFHVVIRPVAWIGWWMIEVLYRQLHIQIHSYKIFRVFNLRYCIWHPVDLIFGHPFYSGVIPAELLTLLDHTTWGIRPTLISYPV